MSSQFSQNQAMLLGFSMQQRNVIIALAAIIAALPKDSINQEAVRKNIGLSPLFSGVAQKQPEVGAEAEKLAGLILGWQ